MTKGTCKACDIEFTKNTNRQIFCSRPCQVKFNGAKNSRDRSNKYYSKLRPFIKHLLQLSTYKRKDLSEEFLLEMYEKQRGCCAVTKQPLTHVRGKGKVNTNLSIDRIDSAKGYTKDNVQLVCRIVNVMKLDMSEEELHFWCNAILSNTKETGKK